STEALAEGRGGSATLDAVRQAAEAVRGRGACAHPDGASRFVLSALDVFTEDVTEHVMNGSCGRRTRRVLPVPREVDERMARDPGGAGTGRLVVDWSRCDGHGLCAGLVPGFVTLDVHGYPVIPPAPVPARLERAAERAVGMCPALALRIERTPR